MVNSSDIWQSDYIETMNNCSGTKLVKLLRISHSANYNKTSYNYILNTSKPPKISYKQKGSGHQWSARLGID